MGGRAKEIIMLIDALMAMEAARRILGHFAVLEDAAIAALDHEDPKVVLGRYAKAVLRRQDEESDEDSVVPVIPGVDPTAGHVMHRTCTGRTMLVVRGFWHSMAGGMATGDSQIFRSADAPPL